MYWRAVEKIKAMLEDFDLSIRSVLDLHEAAVLKSPAEILNTRKTALI